MFQVSTIASDDAGMLVFLSVGGMGMFFLVITLAFLAARLASNKHNQDDMEGIMEADEEDFSEHFENIENEGAIFIIEERETFDAVNIVNPQTEEMDKNKAISISIKQQIFSRIVNKVKLRGFTN